MWYDEFVIFLNIQNNSVKSRRRRKLTHFTVSAAHGDALLPETTADLLLPLGEVLQGEGPMLICNFFL